MKINDVGRVGAVNPYSKSSEQRETKLDRKKQTDNVQISKEAQELHSIDNQDQAKRSEQVANLKRQVQSGTYFVESGKIAEKLYPFFK